MPLVKPRTMLREWSQEKSDYVWSWYVRKYKHNTGMMCLYCRWSNGVFCKRIQLLGRSCSALRYTEHYYYMPDDM